MLAVIVYDNIYLFNSLAVVYPASRNSAQDESLVHAQVKPCAAPRQSNTSRKVWQQILTGTGYDIRPIPPADLISQLSSEAFFSSSVRSLRLRPPWSLPFRRSHNSRDLLLRDIRPASFISWRLSRTRITLV